jgi:hypothetical protein
LIYTNLDFKISRIAYEKKNPLQKLTDNKQTTT